MRISPYKLCSSIMALLTALLLMFVFRAWVFTIYTISDATHSSRLMAGDRVVVNRWSYGLRTGGSCFFSYSRLFPSPIGRGDLIAFNIPDASHSNLATLPVAVGIVKAIPGDTITIGKRQYAIPTYAKSHSCMPPQLLLVEQESDGKQLLIEEKYVVGRVLLVAYHQQGFFFDKKRWMLIP